MMCDMNVISQSSVHRKVMNCCLSAMRQSTKPCRPAYCIHDVDVNGFAGRVDLWSFLSVNSRRAEHTKLFVYDVLRPLLFPMHICELASSFPIHPFGHPSTHPSVHPVIYIAAIIWCLKHLSKLAICPISLTSPLKLWSSFQWFFWNAHLRLHYECLPETHYV